MSWRDRIAQARSFLDAFSPEWISVQFVPYGFHDKGVAWNLGSYLRAFTEGLRVQIMFHELWLGAYSEASIKERLIGALQRACIHRILRSLRPSVINTSNSAYVGLLKRSGVEAKMLPLFGSIPLAQSTIPSWLADEIGRSGPGGISNDAWLFCMFGSLHPIWPAEPLFRYLLEAGQRHERRIVLISVGRLGPGEALWDQLAARYRGTIQFIKLGTRSTAEVSTVLQASDFGIATSPWELIGKSSTVASMREHGLPVIVNRDDVHFGITSTSEPGNSLVVKLDADLPSTLPTLRKSAPQSRVEPISEEFLLQLERISNPAP
jgi:hypothetical protein